MAHFAQLDENNVVINVIVVHNNDCLDENGNESEQKGIDFCVSHFGGRWLQTSYNRKIRENYAGIGYTYDADTDMFLPPKPYPSWEYSTLGHEWEAPIAKPLDIPEHCHCVWNESTLQWDIVPLTQQELDEIVAHGPQRYWPNWEGDM